jgi:phenylalanyl-tRNA synthetase alpha chain
MTTEDLLLKLHPLERKVLPSLKKGLKNFDDIVKDSKLQPVEVMRALQWLQNKKVVKLDEQVRQVVSLDANGKVYVEKGLPERRFLKAALKEKGVDAISKSARLSKEEVGVCIGTLKKKAAIAVSKGPKGLQVELLPAGNALVDKEMLEEKLLRNSKQGLPLEDLKPEEAFAFEVLKSRKQLIKVDIVKKLSVKLTGVGKELVKKKLDVDLSDALTPGMLKEGSWKDKKFRAYDIKINVPKINRSKRHFVNQSISYIKKIWLEMGFVEMQGSLTQTSFWDLDSLFVPQDHPARTMQDTFYIKDPKKGRLPKVAKVIKEVHENGGDTGSTGWRSKWSEEAAKENLLRTHTTVLSAQTISKLKDADIPAKFFSVGRVFRNEELDAHHLFEFYQVEGIVVDPNANLKNLKGYLKEFFGKMGFTDVRMRPAHFPYTEPSVEVDVFDPHHLIGKEIPVLAWGMGMERIISSYFNITDIRDLYRNDLKKIREMKEWMK